MAFFEPFKAPELYLDDEKPTIKSDVYALGVVIYYLCEFQYPFDNVRSAVNHIAPKIDD